MGADGVPAVRGYVQCTGQRGAVFTVEDDQADDITLFAGRVHAHAVHQRRHGQNGLHLGQRHVLAQLELDQVLLAVCR